MMEFEEFRKLSHEEKLKELFKAMEESEKIKPALIEAHLGEDEHASIHINGRKKELIILSAEIAMHCMEQTHIDPNNYIDLLREHMKRNGIFEKYDEHMNHQKEELKKNIEKMLGDLF